MGGFLTLSDFRRLTGKPSHVVNHALERFGPEPCGRIGITRVWSTDALPAVLESLRKTAENRKARAPEVVA